MYSPVCLKVIACITKAADLYNPFLTQLTVFGEPIYNELLRKREEAIKEYKDISANIYASCWNLDKNENYLITFQSIPFLFLKHRTLQLYFFAFFTKN